MASAMGYLYQDEDNVQQERPGAGRSRAAEIARRYLNESDQGDGWMGGISPPVMSDEMKGSKSGAGIGMAPLNDAAQAQRFAGDALLGLGETKATEYRAEGMEESAKIQERARKDAANKNLFGDILKTAGTVASAALFACDERLKTDMAPLQRYEVDDRLARLAVAVQALRGDA